MYKDSQHNLMKELMCLPTQNYWVKFTYHNRKNLKNVLEFSFPQYDCEPYFPRINRFYEFCSRNMKQFKFVDYEITEYPNEIKRYCENIDKEFIIH
tara:strand:+ start:551 stop:838 length:288 start_codon:yes stop_codon:yes gene_type:complete